MKTEVKAVVAVVQTTSERDRSSEAGHEAYLGLQATIPWIEFRFYDEHSIEQCYRDVQDGALSSLIFASNSLFNPLIYGATEEASRIIQRRSQRGMGIIVLQQFLPQGKSCECLFLPINHQVTFKAIPPLTMETLTVNDRTIHVRDGTAFTGVLGDFTVRAPTLWSIAEPQLASEWSPIAWARTGDGVKTVIQRSRSPRARTIVSSIPLDWLERRDLLANLVARSVMFNGTLYVHPKGQRLAGDAAMRLALGRASQCGRHLASHEIGALEEIDVAGYPYRHFNHLLVHPSWGWSDISNDLRLALRRRLENDGSVTACADGSVTGVPMMVSVGGRPAYLQLADRCALFLASSGEAIFDTPAPPIRALAALAAAVSMACEHNDAVPRAFHLESLRKQFAPYFKRRLRNGSDNVDREAMPTAALASAMRLLGMDAAQSDPLVRWLESGDFLASPAVLRQAKVWLPDMTLPDLPPPATAVDELYDQLGSYLTSTEAEIHLSWLTTRLEDRNGLVSHRAIIAEALTASGRAEAIAAVALSARTLLDDLDHAYRQAHPALELVALLTSALIRLHKQGAFGVDLSAAIPEVGRNAEPDGAEERLYEEVHRDREERLRLDTFHQEQVAALRDERARAESLSRKLISVFTVFLWMGITGAVLVLYVMFGRGLGDAAALAGVGSVLLGASVQVIGKQSAEHGCEPAFLAAIRFWRGG